MTLKNNTDIGGRGRRCNLVNGPIDFVWDCRELKSWKIFWDSIQKGLRVL